MYTDGRYSLNLTSIAGWRLEYESSDFFYYYTPCTNNERCPQGNALFYANSVQYKPGENTCSHYLSVDHHEQPTYFFGGASWAFQYEDGELCDSTQEPRDMNVWYICDENFKSGAYVSDVFEYETCRYAMQIRSPLACVPESKHNANCQWRVHGSDNTTYNLDLSNEKGNIYRGAMTENGYEMFYSPCANNLYCYQQTGQTQMMSIVENMVTRTCDHYLAEWQDGRVQPIFHDSDPQQVHWSFHYWLSEQCSNGEPGEETIRWYCDPSATNSTVLNATYDGNCKWEMNMASAAACPADDMYRVHNGIKFDLNQLDRKSVV